MLCCITQCYATLCVALQFSAAEPRHYMESNVIPRVVVMHLGLHYVLEHACHQKYMFLRVGLFQSISPWMPVLFLLPRPPPALMGLIVHTFRPSSSSFSRWCPFPSSGRNKKGTE